MSWQEEALLTVSGTRSPWRGQIFRREEDTFATNGHRLLIVPGSWLEEIEPTRSAPNLTSVLVGLKVVGTVRVDDLRQWCAGVPLETVCADCEKSPNDPQPKPVKCDLCLGDGECPHCSEECRDCDGTGFSVEGCPDHGAELKLKKTSEFSGTVCGHLFDRRLFVDIAPLLPGDVAEVSVTDFTARFDGDGWTFVVMGLRDDDPTGHIRPDLKVAEGGSK